MNTNQDELFRNIVKTGIRSIIYGGIMIGGMVGGLCGVLCIGEIMVSNPLTTLALGVVLVAGR